MIIVIIFLFVAFIALTLLVLRSVDILNQHAVYMRKNRNAIEILSKRLDDVSSMVSLCPDDVNTQDFFEDGENNEQ